MFITKIRAEFFYSPYYSKEFFFPHAIVELGIDEEFGNECDGSFAIVVYL